MWSDNELVLPYLGDIQDLLDSCRKKSIIEILDKTTTSLYSVSMNKFILLNHLYVCKPQQIQYDERKNIFYLPKNS